ncbi:MAG: signal peptidase I [Rhizobiaceae bacterium]|nr:signal peptidase I [Rhizobiaceae bacterium]
MILQALLLAIVVRTLVFQPFSIPSGSMMPNLLVGDYLFVSKFSYGYSRYSIDSRLDMGFKGRIWEGKPVRGDVAVFKFPPNPQIDYIKRVVGLPGDKIQVIDSLLYINGVAVKRERKGDFLDQRSGVSVPIYTETLPNGVSYDTLDIRLSDGDNTNVFEVPAGHYFMMGDNRDNSSDSRYAVGFVPAENLVGRAKFVFFSVSDGAHPLAFWRWFSTIRSERFFTGL